MLQPRFLLPEEFDELIDLLNRVFRLDRGERPNYLRMYKPAYRKSECGNHLVIDDGKRLLSHAAFYPRKAYCEDVELDVAAIGGVGTDQSARGRGLASKLVAETMRQLDLRGTDVAVLWTSLEGFYEPFGFEWAGQSLVWQLPKGKLKRIRTPKVTPYAYRGEPLFAHSLLHLHRGQPLRLARSLADFQEWLDFELNRAWFVWRETHASSYIVVRSDYQDERCDLQEWGGDALEAIGLLKLVAKEYSGREVRLATPPGYSALGDVLAKAGFEPTPSDHAMIAIVSGQQLLDRLQPLLARRAKAAGVRGRFNFEVPGLGKLVLDLGQGKSYRIACNRGEFTRALFGNPKAPVDAAIWAPLEGVLPAPLWWGRLEAI